MTNVVKLRKPPPTAFLIRAIGFADGTPCPHTGHWLMAFDHDAHDGLGHGIFTTSVNSAKRFASMGDAMEFWRRQSTVKPLRADGRPNKPLTALTIEIEELP